MIQVSFWLLFSWGCTPSTQAEDPDLTIGNLDPVEVVVDELGIPHLYAETDLDLFHAAGYQMAVDRLYQTQMLRRFSHGRMSEVLGEEALPRDQQARIFDFPALGAADAQWMAVHDPERSRLLRAWVSGINRRIDEVLEGSVPLPFGFGPDHLDFLPEHWSFDDPYTVLKGANFALDSTLEFEIALTLVGSLYGDLMEEVEILRPGQPTFSIPDSERQVQDSTDSRAASSSMRIPGIPETRLSPVSPLSSLPRAQGSNNWAVDGRHTTSGMPMLAGDPHMGFDFFGSPYPLHLNSKDADGNYDVAGFAFPGTPGIALGHTDQVAWSATTSFADVMDTWMVTREGGGVVVGHEVAPIETRKEEFLVRGSNDPAGEGTIVTVFYEDVPGIGVMVPPEFLPLPIGDFLVRWTGLSCRRASWFLELNQATSIQEFEDAVDRMVEMNQNLVAASADGISYRVGIEVPDRGLVGGSITPWEAMDGDDPSTWWTGEMLDRSYIPASRAPDRGWLATANNDPFGFTANGRLDDDPWYYGALFAPGYRAHRIESELTRLTGTGPLAAADMMTLQLDTHSTLADNLLPLLADAYQRVGSDPDLEEFADLPDLDALVTLLTIDWDRRMTRDSPGALAFQAYLHDMTQAVLEDEMTLAYDFAITLKSVFMMKIAALAMQGVWADADVVEDGVDHTLLSAATSTARWLVDRTGGVGDMALGEVKATRFDHALGYGIPLDDHPTDGGEDTINVSQNITNERDGGPWISTHVSAERMVVEFDSEGVPRAWVNFPYASSADPDSAVSQTAMTDYLEGGYRLLPFRRAELDAVAVETTVLEAF